MLLRFESPSIEPGATVSISMSADCNFTGQRAVPVEGVDYGAFSLVMLFVHYLNQFYCAPGPEAARPMIDVIAILRCDLSGSSVGTLDTLHAGYTPKHEITMGVRNNNDRALAFAIDLSNESS